MARVADFRKTAQFSSERIRRSGTNVGRVVYPKLYSVENLLRILTHTILTAQQTPPTTSWWVTAVSPGVQRTIASQRNQLQSNPLQVNAGPHEIYFTTLRQLIDIIAVNSGAFVSVIPDIAQWIVRIEMIRPPRNLVAHMNFPNATDRKKIDALHKDLKNLVDSLHSSKTITLLIP